MSVVAVAGSDEATSRDHASIGNLTPSASETAKFYEQATVRKFTGGVWQYAYGAPFTAPETRVVWSRDSWTTDDIAGTATGVTEDG